jgi:uncharacterized membrane protein
MKKHKKLEPISWSFVFIAFFLVFMWIILNFLVIFDFISWDKYTLIHLNLFISFVSAFQAIRILMN